MPLNSKFCLICKESFVPDPRTCRHQKVCSGASCQRERKRRQWRRWAAGHKKQKKIKARLWAQSRPGYWAQYRKSHPAYRIREIKRLRLKRRSLRRVAKQTLIRHDFVDRLRAIESMDPGGINVAKQTLMARQIRGVIECLIWKEAVAKQTAMALPWVRAG